MGAHPTYNFIKSTDFCSISVKKWPIAPLHIGISFVRHYMYIICMIAHDEDTYIILRDSRKDQNVGNKNILHHTDWERANWPARVLTGFRQSNYDFDTINDTDPLNMDVTFMISHFELGRLEAAKTLMWNSCFQEGKCREKKKKTCQGYIHQWILRFVNSMFFTQSKDSKKLNEAWKLHFVISREDQITNYKHLRTEFGPLNMLTVGRRW